MNDKWKEAVKKARHYLAVGQHEIYLSDSDEKPWALAIRCEPGGTHRLDINTDVWFYAQHSSGLQFRWSFDIEPRSANGTGSYDIDVNAIQNVLYKLPPKVQLQFKNYLMTCIEAVENKAVEWQAITDKQYATARRLKTAIEI
jgi:hypothetical protein